MRCITRGRGQGQAPQTPREYPQRWVPERSAGRPLTSGLGSGSSQAHPQRENSGESHLFFFFGSSLSR